MQSLCVPTVYKNRCLLVRLPGECKLTQPAERICVPYKKYQRSQYIADMLSSRFPTELSMFARFHQVQQLTAGEGRKSTMVYARKSVSKMATAAAASASECLSSGAEINTVAVDAAAAVHAAMPDDAPARAAEAAADAGASGAVCTAIAAAVATAAVGGDFEAIKKASKAAFEGFTSSVGADPALVAERVHTITTAFTKGCKR